jgi:hypothetical protein
MKAVGLLLALVVHWSAGSLVKELLLGGVPGFLGYSIFNPTNETGELKDKVITDIKRESQTFEASELGNLSQLQGLSELVGQAEYHFNTLEKHLGNKISELQARANQHIADTNIAGGNKIVVTHFNVPNLKG